MKTFWDIYYWIDMKVKEENTVPTIEEIYKRYKDYDKKIISKAINFYNTINEKDIIK